MKFHILIDFSEEVYSAKINNSSHHIFVSLEKVTCRDYFHKRWAASGFSCSEHNFVTVGPNHSKLGMHVSSNDSKCSAQEP